MGLQIRAINNTGPARNLLFPRLNTENGYFGVGAVNTAGNPVDLTALPKATAEEVLNNPFLKAAVTAGDITLQFSEEYLSPVSEDNADILGSAAAGIAVGGGALTLIGTGLIAPQTKAAVTIDPAGINNALVYTAVKPGAAPLQVEYLVGGALAIGVSGTKVQVTVKNDGTSTANAVIAALAGHAVASLMMVAANAAGNDGTGTIPAVAVAATSLTGGFGNGITAKAGGLACDITSVTETALALSVPNLAPAGFDATSVVKIEVNVNGKKLAISMLTTA